MGPELAGRHHQYEMFYAGAPFAAEGYPCRGYDYIAPPATVTEFLASYSIESAS